MTIRARKYLLQKKISSVPPIFSQKFVPTLSMDHAGYNLILRNFEVISTIRIRKTAFHYKLYCSKYNFCKLIKLKIYFEIYALFDFFSNLTLMKTFHDIFYYLVYYPSGPICRWKKRFFSETLFENPWYKYSVWSLLGDRISSLIWVCVTTSLIWSDKVLTELSF